MKILGILLLIFIGILILIFGILAYEIWSIIQVYRSVTDVASLKNLKKIQRVALWLINWWEKRRNTTMLLLIALVFTGCHGGTVPKSIVENDSVPEEPDPNRVYNKDGEKTWWSADTYIIDSCEYVCISIDESWVHKGNCKFCKKRRDEEIDRIINALCARP